MVSTLTAMSLFLDELSFNKIPQEIGKNESGVFLSEHGKLIMLTSEVESS